MAGPDDSHSPDESGENKEDVESGEKIVLETELERDESEVEDEVEYEGQCEFPRNFFLKIFVENEAERDGDEYIEHGPHRAEHGCGRRPVRLNEGLIPRICFHVLILTSDNISAELFSGGDMKKLWWPVLFVACLLMGQKILAQEGVSADALLKTAIAKVPNCAPTSTTYEITGGGEKAVPTNEDRSAAKDLLTLPFLFKPGRYTLTLVSEDNDNTITLRFSPKPDKEHMPPPPGASIEAKAINWGMNRMNGRIVLDKESGEIISIKADTPANLKVKKYGDLFTADLYQLDFEHVQSSRGSTWYPEKTEVTLHFRATFKGSVHQRSLTTFDCAKK